MANSSLADLGMIGIGVMGRNLALNMADHGFRVAASDLNADAVRRLVEENPDTPGGLVGCGDLRGLVRSLKRPRKIMLMIKAGAPVDQVIDRLLPIVDRGDVIIDGGNSLWTDTVRRAGRLEEQSVHFVGSGVSGGEEGARFGPSLMPGCSREAWRAIKPIWTAIAARVDRKTGKPIEGAAPGRPIRGGEPCAAWIGPDGAGHYVKMVHNGIEYADMQLICEAYHLLREVGGMKPAEISEVFAGWNRGDLDSFLIEITADILQQSDPASRGRKPFVDVVLDTAGQKGTGRWTSVNSLDMGVAAPTIAEAVFARILSSIKEERVVASKKLRAPRFTKRVARGKLVDAVRDALYASKICAYAQGFALMSEAQREYGWKLDFGAIARIWRGGCIIRARFLQKIADAYTQDRKLANLLLDPHFRRKVRAAQEGWRHAIVLAAEAGVPCPAFMSSLAYFDGYRSARLPASLLQAQRDYFGAHGYERVDRPRGKTFHVDWLAPGRPELKR